MRQQLRVIKVSAVDRKETQSHDADDDSAKKHGKSSRAT